MDKAMTRFFNLLSIWLIVDAYAREPQLSPPPSAPTQKVVRARDLGIPFDGTSGELRRASAATSGESIPPDRKTPTGTSLTSCAATLERTAASTSSLTSPGSLITGDRSRNVR